MTEKLDHKQHELILSHTGDCNVAELMRCVAACGFDPATYIANHEDLRRANLIPAQALSHFLCFGWRENRAVTAGPLPAGMADLFQLPMENIAYKNRLLSALFLGQMRAANVAERLWAGDIDRTILDLQTGKARPFLSLATVTPNIMAEQPSVSNIGSLPCCSRVRRDLLVDWRTKTPNHSTGIKSSLGPEP